MRPGNRLESRWASPEMSFSTFLFKKALFQGRARQAPEDSESRPRLTTGASLVLGEMDPPG